MNKIIKALLEAKYPTIDTSVLLEVVSVTPNAEIATEMLCGLYEDPVIPNKMVNAKTREGVLTFIKYDKWTDKVHYSYKTPETKGAYFKSGLKKEDITMENFESMKSSDSNRVWLEIPTGEIIEKTSYVSLDSWNSYPKELSEREKKQLEAQQVYG